MSGNGTNAGKTLAEALASAGERLDRWDDATWTRIAFERLCLEVAEGASITDEDVIGVIDAAIAKAKEVEG